MNFSSLLFIFFFLPIFYLLFILLPKSKRYIVLIIFNLIFYLYSGIFNFCLLIFTILFNYFYIKLLGKKYQRSYNVLVIINILFLSFFKYTNYFIFPLGISFYTFNNISYILDRKHNKIKNESFLDYLCYITLFCNVLMGPITRFNEVTKNIRNLDISFETGAKGFYRFLTGLFQKVLLANNLSTLYNTFNSITNKTFLSCLFVLIIYALYLYFDFLGYTNMALGLGKMCGISLEKNFDNPYLANSISSFWRKWHISLSNFFKEYVYFPLGGSKKNKLITIRNLMVVWLLTGIWHGNTINFLLWGLYYGIIIVLEKFVLNNFLEKLPKIFKHLYVIIIVLFGYILFTQNSLNDISLFISNMFKGNLYNNEVIFYLRDNLFLIILSLLMILKLPESIKNKISNNKFINIVIIIIYVCLFIITVSFILSGSFKPFLYNSF